MKLEDIIVRVQRQFGDDVQAQITKEDIVRWVNDACQEIAINNTTNQGMLKGQAPVEAGKATYNLPNDLLLLKGVRANGMKLAHTTFEQLSEMPEYSEAAVGASSLYWVFDNKVNLYPCPSESLGTLDVYYVKTPDLMDVNLPTREPDVPKEYHARIVEYCIAQAAELDDNLAHYQMKMGQFKDNLQSLKQNGERPESDDTYPFITYMNEWV